MAAIRLLVRWHGAMVPGWVAIEDIANLSCCGRLPERGKIAQLDSKWVPPVSGRHWPYHMKKNAATAVPVLNALSEVLRLAKRAWRS